MVRKVFRSGNSLVVALPADALDALRLAEGSEVDIEVDETHARLVLTPVRPLDPEITPEYVRKVDDFIAAYRPALEALAKR